MPNSYKPRDWRENGDPMRHEDWKDHGDWKKGGKWNDQTFHKKEERSTDFNRFNKSSRRDK